MESDVSWKIPGHPLTVPVGDELLGHMVDGIGRPTDTDELTFNKEYPVEALPPVRDKRDH